MSAPTSSSVRRPAFVYAAAVERVVDADTLDVSLDLGMRVHFRVRLRLAHVDAPEKHTAEGREATAYLQALLSAGTAVVVATQKPDKYGRTLADVQMPDGRDVATLLLDAGHVRAYEGGAR